MRNARCDRYSYDIFCVHLDDYYSFAAIKVPNLAKISFIYTRFFSFFSDLCHMIGTSWFFILIFAIPLIVFLVWLMKQDKRRGALGIILVLLAAAVAMYVSTKYGSGLAAANFELRKKEAQEQQQGE